MAPPTSMKGGAETSPSGVRLECVADAVVDA